MFETLPTKKQQAILDVGFGGAAGDVFDAVISSMPAWLMTDLPADPSASAVEVPSRLGLRLFAGFGLILYGCGKLTGAQFTILDSELDRPLRDVSGFWLTWYYFGFSFLYKNLIASLEILVGLSLFYRRSSLVGACVASLLLCNIVAIDVCFGIDLSGLLAAAILLVCTVTIIADFGVHLRRSLWATMPSSDPRWVKSHGAALGIGALVVAVVFQYWVANYNNREPTAIDGAWHVSASSGSEPSTIYFERQRAHLCVFTSNAVHVQHDFEYSPADATVAIFEKWLDTRSALLYRGRVSADGAIRLTNIRTGGPLLLSRLPIAH